MFESWRDKNAYSNLILKADRPSLPRRDRHYEIIVNQPFLDRIYISVRVNREKSQRDISRRWGTGIICLWQCLIYYINGDDQKRKKNLYQQAPEQNGVDRRLDDLSMNDQKTNPANQQEVTMTTWPVTRDRIVQAGRIKINSNNFIGGWPETEMIKHELQKDSTLLVKIVEY